MLTAVESSQYNNGSPRTGASVEKSQRQRVTITLPVELLERLRNAVYWTGHGPLARLIADALDDAVTQMEESNGQPFPPRLAPLKRGRPRTKPRSPIPILKIQSV
jgi:hypothetical protein